MMRRLLEIGIIEAFEAKGIAAQNQGCRWKLFSFVGACGLSVRRTIVAPVTKHEKGIA